MRAGAGADNQEEGVADLAMEPDDAGQPAEDFALPALAQDRQGFAPDGSGRRPKIEGNAHVHGASPGERQPRELLRRMRR